MNPEQQAKIDAITIDQEGLTSVSKSLIRKLKEMYNIA